MSMSGSQLKGFTEGWAVVIGSFGAGHYFKRKGITNRVVSSCGVHAEVRHLYGIGTWTPCRHCVRKHGTPLDVRTCLDILGAA